MTYFMRCVYEQDDEEHPQVGVFTFEPNDVITGAIIDQRSEYPREKIEGTLIMKDERVIITFTKTPTGTRYVMEKTDGIETVEGKYKGYWRFKEQGLESKRERDEYQNARMTLDSRV
jgi:hypothetical protein